MSFKKFKTIAATYAEMREIEPFEIAMYKERGALYFFEDSDKENKHPLKISISQEFFDAGSPKEGDMIVRNPENHTEQWLISEEYFRKNFFVPEVGEPKIKQWKSEELTEYINQQLKTDGDHMYVEFETEQDLMNAIAGRFGFKQDGSFKMVAGIHEIKSGGTTEYVWRMYGKFAGITDATLNSGINYASFAQSLAYGKKSDNSDRAYTPGIVDVNADSKGCTQSEEIKPGSLVILRSGSPRMTVNSLAGKMAYVHWFDDSGLKDAQLNIDQLKVVG